MTHRLTALTLLLTLATACGNGDDQIVVSGDPMPVAVTYRVTDPAVPALDPLTVTTTTVPHHHRVAAPLPAPGGGHALASGGCGATPAECLERIAICESEGDWTARNPTSTASGRWQFLQSTWLAWRGASTAPEAWLATPEEQTAAAHALYAAKGTRPWNASRHCWGR